jgi:hypothetical protein
MFKFYPFFAKLQYHDLTRSSPDFDQRLLSLRAESVL